MGVPMRRDAFAAHGPDRRVTEPDDYFNRRLFLRMSAAVGLLGPTAACAPGSPAVSESEAKARLTPPFERPGVFPARRVASPGLPAGIDAAPTPPLQAAGQNNFYEFVAGRAGDVWPLTGDFVVEPWKLEVTGECRKPQVFDLDALFGFEHEERMYHFRCVERWAMNVPWSGFPLSRLLDRVEPTGNATHLRFISASRPEQMPGMRQSAFYPWPYHEALRMDEATNELALVATGIYGKPLLKQHGAPVRIIVPWKYGYKNPKSIVKIELLGGQPKTFWQLQPHEYGFLSNVNPNIPHPRWSQARSYWVDRQGDWFDTPIFNGYGQYVAKLYPDEPREPQAPLHRGQIAR